MKCLSCGENMICKIEEHTLVWECPKCGDGLATTYFEPIETDDTEYSISISAISSPDINQIKLVSNILNVNFIKTKFLLQEGNATIADKAVKIRDYARSLNEKSVQFKITPDFPYEVK